MNHRAKMFLALPLLLAVFGALTMFLWNFVLTAVLGVSSISFWQALGLLLLCRILFGGLGIHGFMHMRGGLAGRRPGHWHKMDPEQRRELLERFGGFHGRFHERFQGRFDGPHPHAEGGHGKPDGDKRCCGRSKPCDSPAEDTERAEEAK